MGCTKATHILGGIFLGFSLHYFHYEVPGIPLKVIFSSLVIDSALIHFWEFFLFYFCIIYCIILSALFSVFQLWNAVGQILDLLDAASLCALLFFPLITSISSTFSLWMSSSICISVILLNCLFFKNSLLLFFSSFCILSCSCLLNTMPP